MQRLDGAAGARILAVVLIQLCMSTTTNGVVIASSSPATAATTAPTTPPGGSVNSSLCPAVFPLTHTACLSRSANATAPMGVTSVDIAQILVKHNQLRALPNATNMQTMYWDDTVAYVAEKWAENCQFQHDSQRNIPNVYSVGQNLAYGQPTWNDAIQAWYDEVHDFTYGDPNYVFSKIGHYTQLVWSSSVRIGCGFATCKNLPSPKFYVCNYAPAGNIVGSIQIPYAYGTRCAACPNKCKNSLCDCGGLVCKNGGTLNLNTCTCSCPPLYTGLPDCNLNCTGARDATSCGQPQPYGFPASSCSISSNVPQACPIMCGVCSGTTTTPTTTRTTPTTVQSTTPTTTRTTPTTVQTTTPTTRMTTLSTVQTTTLTTTRVTPTTVQSTTPTTTRTMPTTVQTTTLTTTRTTPTTVQTTTLTTARTTPTTLQTTTLTTTKTTATTTQITTPTTTRTNLTTKITTTAATTRATPATTTASTATVRSTVTPPTTQTSPPTTPAGGSVNSSLCPAVFPLTHTACLNRSASAIAPIGVTSADIAQIVAKHNQLRALPNATNMQAMYWDPTVAYVAQKWAENCQFQHDTERDIPNFYSVGQNIAYGFTSWTSAIQVWYDEVRDFMYGNTTYEFSKIGHYTQVVWSSSARLGCGFAACSNLRYRTLFVCNYAPAGNDEHIPTPYKNGTKCAACPNTCKNSLCDCGGLFCKNGGTLNLNTCTCSCPPLYTGQPDCNLNCTGVRDASYCGIPRPRGFTKDLCPIFYNVPLVCPIMCGLCTATGKK